MTARCTFTFAFLERKNVYNFFFKKWAPKEVLFIRFIFPVQRLEPGHHDHLPAGQLRGRRPPRQSGQPDRARTHVLQPDGDLHLLPGAVHAAAGADCPGAGHHHCHLPLVRRRLPGLHVLHLSLHHVPPLPGRPCTTLLFPRHEGQLQSIVHCIQCTVNCNHW